MSFTSVDYLVAIMAAEAICISTTDLPLDSPIYRLARDLREELNNHAKMEKLPKFYSPKMPPAYTVLLSLAGHAKEQVFRVKED